ncbi:MAG: DUF481 domain-containing protein [Myxococcales bacterium]|nr:DUF481 domain-containing protein [Myxococcales bacterium]
MMLLVALTTISMAQDTEFAGTEAPPEEDAISVDEAETNLSAELGGIWTSGNAQAYSLNAGLLFGNRWERNKIGIVAGAAAGAAVADVNANGLLEDDEIEAGYIENARRFFGEVRYDRYVSGKDSFYGLVGGFHDRFAGYDLRSHEQVGYSRLLVDEESTNVRGEVGIDWAQEFYTLDSGADPRFQNIFAARLLLGATHAFNENVSVADTFEIYENVVDLADVRILNTASLSASLSSDFTVKLSHSLIWDNVPVTGFRKFDQTTGVTLVATLL